MTTPTYPKAGSRRKILQELLRDRTTGRNIIWATDDYASRGDGYTFADTIEVEKITGANEGVIRPRSAKDKFLDGTASLYYTGSKFPTTIALQDLHYFMPYIKDRGIHDVYEITRVRTISSRETQSLDGEEDVDDLRLAFELLPVRRQYPDYRSVASNRMFNSTFLDTTFSELESYLVP